MPTDPMLTFMEEVQREIFKSTGLQPIDPTELQSPDFPRRQGRRRILDRRHLFEPFATFAINLVRETVGWRVLFLERDALPLLHLTQRAADHFDARLDLDALAFNRKMLPSQLVDELAAVPKSNTEDEFRRKRVIVEQYVRSGAYPQSERERERQELLHEMILARAANASRVMVVDTGYIGTICIYVTTLLNMIHPDIQTDWRLVRGMPGSNALTFGGGENGPILQQERCSFAFELSGQIKRDVESGRLDAERVEIESAVRQMRYAGELEALYELLDEKLRPGDAQP